MQIKIKSWFDGKVLFSCEAGSFKLAVELAIKSRANLSRADLSGADLSGANLSRANLSRADLSGADLSGANLSRANLSRANLSGADLSRDNLSRANLSGADLSEANLLRANLSRANLSRANLSGANLSRVNLSGAKDAEYAIAQTRMLPEGDIIGWKQCKNDVIVKLKIPAKSKRSSAFGRKCRCEYAKVLEVIGAEIGESIEQSYGGVIYKKGKTVRCHKWDDNFENECSGGIHFFITRLEAENHN